MQRVTERAMWIGGLALGSAAVGVAIYEFTKPKAPASPPPAVSVTPGLQNLSLHVGGGVIMLAPNIPQSQEGFAVGDAVTILLPAGGSWSPGGANPPSGFTPMSFTYQAPQTLTLKWLDPNFGEQTTSLVLYTLAH